MTAPGPSTYVDPQGHTVMVDGDTAYYDIHGCTYVLTVGESREWWAKSARVAASHRAPHDPAGRSPHATIGDFPTV